MFDFRKILLGTAVALGLGIAAIPEIAEAQTISTCNLNAGQIGQCFISSTLVGAAITLTTTATAYDLAGVGLPSFVNLPPGHWACQASVIATAAGTTFPALVVAWNTTSVTLPTAPAGGYSQSIISATTGVGGVQSGIAMFDLTVPTSLYIVVQGTFTGTAPTAYGQGTCWQRG